jgi:hypothetical protein
VVCRSRTAFVDVIGLSESREQDQADTQQAKRSQASTTVLRMFPIPQVKLTPYQMVDYTPAKGTESSPLGHDPAGLTGL